MEAFIRYLLAYPSFRALLRENDRDVIENGWFGQPARNSGRCASWVRKTA